MARVVFCEDERAEEMVRDIARNMRKMDVFELEAIGYTDREQAIREGMEGSEITMFFGHREKPVCIFGVSKENYAGGRIIWCLGTDGIDECKKSFVKESRRILAEWTAEYGMLFNFVSVKNKRAIAWLKRMGAVFHDARPINANGDKFMMFTIGGAKNVQCDSGADGT